MPKPLSVYSQKPPFATILGITGIISATIIAQLPALAGAQSLLDPYAEIQPENNKPAKKIFKPFSQQKSKKVKEVAIPVHKRQRIARTTTPKSIKTNNVNSITVQKDSPNFMTGIKEIGHGYMTSLKAAGTVITKPLNLISSKAQPSTKNQSTRSALHTNETNIAELPGRPLDQALVEKKRDKQLKDVPVNEEIKTDRLAIHNLGKFNFFHKNKKHAPVNVASANSPGTRTH